MTIANLAPIIVARAHQVLRKRLPLLVLCNKDFKDVPSGVEKNIYIDVPADAGAVAGNASAGAYFDPGTKSNNPKTLTLDQWVDDGWYLADDDIARIATVTGFVPNLMLTSVEKIARRIAQDGWATYKKVYGAVGTAGTTPFATTTDVLVDAGIKLDDQLCPPESRVALYNSKAKAAILKLDSFKGFDKRGDLAPLRDAELGRFLGFDQFLDQAVPLHTAGTLSNGSTHTAKIDGAVAADATTMDIDETTLTGTVVEGDIFTVAGDSQQYVVVSGGTAAGNALAGITFQPPSVAGFADDAVVTFLNSHRVNLGYHPNALYFGSRRMDMSEHAKELLGIAAGQGGQVLAEYSMADPMTGIVLRVTIVRQKYRVVCNFDTLYGWLMVQPKMATRILGEGT